MSRKRKRGRHAFPLLITGGLLMEEARMKRALLMLLVTIVMIPLTAMTVESRRRHRHGRGAGAAKAFLEQFLKPDADRAALSKRLAPTQADCAAVFTGETAAKALAAYTKLFASGKAVVQPNPGQTQLLLFSATTEDLKAGNEKTREFPGGYKQIAPLLKGGLTAHCWKFVKPGETSGMAYDGLYHVNGRWVWFPKPWRFLR